MEDVKDFTQKMFNLALRIKLIKWQEDCILCCGISRPTERHTMKLFNEPNLFI